MTTLSFDPDNTLAGGLYAMTPQECIRLGISLCAAVEQSVGADGCHCAVWPGNISCADGQVAIGAPCRESITDMSPDALEFVSPEQFWSGTSTPASDVYSIGLVLYTALNRGVMPFFSTAEEHDSAERAGALQNRMKGKQLGYPATAGRELGDVVLKAVSFRPEDRFATPGQLKAALESLGEGAAVPAVAPVVPMSASEVRSAHSYRVDKDFEKTEPDKPKKMKKPRKAEGEVNEDMDAGQFRAAPKKKGRWILPAALIAVIVIALIFLLKSCGDQGDPSFPMNTEPLPTAPAETENPIHAPVETASPVAETPEPTEPPEETPAAAPTYELILADVTWHQAKDLCEQKGGHLATVRSAEQFDQITALAAEKGAQFVWLGAYRATDGTWTYVTGEPLEYIAWDKGEPSAKDNDGTPEDYLLLWYRPAVGYWSYNDMRNDPISVARKSYSGKTAYVCQYDN